MIEIVIETLGEIVVDLFLMIILKFNFDKRFEYLERRRTFPSYITYVGVTVLGAFFGFLLSTLIPHKLLPTPVFPGISLFLSPCAVGIVMKLFGDWQKGNQKKATVLATFWGGALFAFGIAFVRWHMVGKVN
jgi:formate-dependent nitrite reductase membrane component NrfD